ncbi:HAD-IA family hydrolase [Paenalcaligenes hominis]|uniref:Phosphoglycolate phosphatase n=1 Tax=Paenalcaligenes hominis TaxID=643674 RepID=A0ABX0WLA0_9BURK|nr:HAD-IA family hydrolase [Paenalcaligenes hominis]NJB63841.1 phosphoglycolate phosphatase [Paenalcaligenes hominis]GGE61033.1 hydrolase [Paenalcaligenes hominis]
MKHYDAVIFDWDGTLMDSTHSIIESIQLASADLGLPVPPAMQASWIIGLSLESGLYKAVPELTAEQMPQFLERYRHHFFQRDATIKMFDGAVPLLDQLRERVVPISVATGKSRIGLDRVLKVVDLAHYFTTTRCADETRGKPDPLMLQEILWELDLQPENVLMVGDTTHDTYMAHNAGMDCLAVTYGAHDIPTLEKSEPTAIVSSVPEMHEWIMHRLKD